MKASYPFLRSRIVMVWTLVLLGMIIYSLGWFTVGIFIMKFIDAIEQSFSFGAEWDSIVQLTKQVVYWHPVLSIFGWLIWGYLNSMRRDVSAWEQ